MLRITHVKAGFFSCCTVKLEAILKYFRQNKKTPDAIDTHGLFNLYKTNPHQDIDTHFFNRQKIAIPYFKDVLTTNSPDEQQFSDYKLLNYADLKPFVEKYFSPTNRVQNHSQSLSGKYAIDYENTCAVFYRGTDKCVETNPPSYQEMIAKALSLKTENPGIKFLVQTDEIQFLQAFSQQVPDTFHIEETPKMNKTDKCNISHVLPADKKLDATVSYVAAILILAKCKYVITTSGNGELWVMLYRGHSQGVYQYLNPKEYIYGVKNKSFIPNKTNFWLS